MEKETNSAEEVAESQTESLQQEERRNDNDHNWSKAREVMSAQAREIQELKETLQSLQAAKREVEDNYDPDDYATYQSVDKRVEKKTQELNSKIAQLEKQVQQTAQERMENQIRSTYEDYDYVIENFAIPMLEKDKSLANTLKHASNPFDLAYKLAKTSKEYENAMKKKNTQAEEKMKKNLERPLSANADGGSLRSQAHQIMNMSAAERWRLSQEYASRA